MPSNLLNSMPRWARCWAREGIETKNSVESGGVRTDISRREANPHEHCETRMDKGFSGEWRRGESNPHLRIANAPSSH